MLVVGGGVVGVCVAYYLARAGRRVCLVERGEVCSGCSHGNAGLLVPSHSVPLAAPGVVAKSLKWMFNPASPFYIKPRLDWELLSWLWRFNRACNRRQVQRAMPLIRDLSMESLRLYDELAADGTEFGLEHKGVLMLYKTEAGLREQVADGKAMGEFGIEARELSVSEISELSPNLRVDALGGVYYPQDGHVTPMQLVPEIARRAREMGVEVHTHTEVLAFERSGARISRVVTTRGDFTPEEVVLTAGSWSGVLARELGLRLPIQGGKGYSITFKRPLEAPSLPIVCGEAKIGVTPMIDALRFAGTLELAGTTVFRNQVRNRGGGRLEITPGATVRFDSTEQTTIEGDGIESFGEIEVGTGGMRVEGRMQSFGKLNVESRITFEARAVVEACVASAEDAEQSVVATCAGALEGATGADARATACAAAAACTPKKTSEFTFAGCLPHWTPTYAMNMSTIVMACNYSGTFDPAFAARFGLVEFDWNGQKRQWAVRSPIRL